MSPGQLRGRLLLQHPLSGRKPEGSPRSGWQRSSAPPGPPSPRRGKVGVKPSKKGHSGGKKGRKGGKEESRVDRPNPPPKAKAKAKAKRRPNKTKRRGGRSNKGLLERAEAGFQDASEELVRRTAIPKPKAVGSKAKPKKRYVLRITPKIEELKRDWASLSFSERVERKKALLPHKPRGTVGEHIVRAFNEACSTCDERGKKQRPYTLDFATQSLIRRRRALKVKKEKKEKKVKKRKREQLLTEDEADDEGAADETESEDPGHRPLGGDGGFGDGASGPAAAVC